MSTLIEAAKALRAFIEQAAQDRPDKDALQFTHLHPYWKAGITCKAGNRYQHDGKLYRCNQTHLSQDNWAPGIAAASLFTEVNESNTGNATDPVPYNNNMELEEGKYYTQAGLIYLCNRSTGIAVFNDLKDLVGIYVTLVAS